MLQKKYILSLIFIITLVGISSFLCCFSLSSIICLLPRAQAKSNRNSETDSDKNIFNKYNNEALLFSTMLYKEPLDKDWWYFTFATGQHISFYKKETLSYIAEKLGLNFYTNGVNMHLMTKKPVSDIKFSLISKFWFIFYFWVYLRMKSKTFADHLMMINRK